MVLVPNVTGMGAAILTSDYPAAEYTYNSHIGGDRSYVQPQTGEANNPIDLTHEDEDDVYNLEGDNGTVVDQDHGYTTRIIRSVDNANFVIRLTFGQDFSFLDDCDGIRVVLLINNQEQSPVTIPTETIANAFGPPKFHTIYEKVIARLPCLRNGKRFFGEMRFARVIVDDDCGQDNAVDVGNIRLHFFRMIAERKQIIPTPNRRIHRALHRLNERARAEETSDIGTPDYSDATGSLKSETPKVTGKALHRATKWTRWTATEGERKPSRGIKPTHVVEFVEPATKKPARPRPRPPPSPSSNSSSSNLFISPDESPSAPKFRTKWMFEDKQTSPEPFARVCFEFRSGEEIAKKILHGQLS